MIDNFITPDMLRDYPTLILIVYAVVQFTKDWNFRLFKIIPINIKAINTRTWTAFIALLVVTYQYSLFSEFKWVHVPIYIFTAVLIAFASNGAYDFGNKVLSGKFPVDSEVAKTTKVSNSK